MKPVFCSKINSIDEFRFTRVVLNISLFLLISIDGFSQCINPPTVTLSSSSGYICGTKAVTISGNTFGGSATNVSITENGRGSVSPTSASRSPFTFTYTPNKNDIGKVVVITVTTNNPSGAPCTAAKATYTLNVNAAISVPQVGTITQPTCALSTGSVILSGLPSGGIWTINPGAISGSGTSSTVSGLIPGTYQFTVTNSVGCISGVSANVVINAPPASPSAPSQTIDCTQGIGKAVVTVTSPRGTGLTYRLDAGTYQSSTSFANVANGNHTITVRNSSGCTTTGVSFSVSCGCENQPTVTLSSNSGSTCGTTPVTVNGNTFGGSATSVSLSENGAGTITPVASDTQPFAFTYTPAAGDAAHTVIITVTTNNPLGLSCAPASASYTLTVTARPSAPVVGTITQPTCTVPSGVVSLSGLPATGTWTLTSSPGGVSTAGTGTSTNITGLSVGTYTFTVTNSAGCTSEASSNVVISSQQSLPTIIITNPAPVCSPLKVDITAAAITAGSTPGLIFTYWTDAAATIAYTTPATASAGTYYIKGTTASGCFDIKPVIVTVNQLPVSNAGTGGNACDLDFKLNASVSIGTGKWTLTTGSGTATFSPDADTPAATVTVSAFGEYTFTWTVVNGTCSNSSAITVIFSQQPVANAGTGGNFCGLEFFLNASLSDGIGTWSKLSGPGNAVFSPDLHQPNAKVIVDKVGTYDFSWTEVNNTCTSNDVVRVIFNGLPLLNAGPDTAICKGANIQFHAQGTGFFTWTPVSLVSNPYISNPVATTGTTTTFTVVLTDQFGCHNSDDVIVEVRENPVANAGPDRVLAGMLSTTMDAELAHEYEIGNWSVISGTGEFFDTTYSKTLVSGLSPDINQFLWRVTNGVCPPSFDTINITVHDFIIPTLITPNMDGKNDYFVLRGLSNTGKTELLIFDRRGAMVYKNLDYDNKWDGVDFNNNPLSDDTYFFVLKTPNGKSNSGYIVIKR